MKTINGRAIVEQSDLIGEIKDFPIEIVQVMVDERTKQGMQIFQENPDDGFIWSNSKEGHEFWAEIIFEKNFDLFFQKYPQNKKVYYRGNDDRYEEIIKALEELGGIDEYYVSGDGDSFFYYIGEDDIIQCCDEGSELSWFLQQCFTKAFLPEKKEVELTMQEIADKFGINVEDLKIKK